jgi:hypothetical protein
MIVFVATVKENALFIDSLKKEGVCVLHPFYNFATEEGAKILEMMQASSPPKYDNFWQTVFKKDVFCIQNSDLVLYDFDNMPDEGRYLSMAACLDKPVIGVSEVLKPAPVYFSGNILSMVKPKQIASVLTFISEHPDFLELPKLVTESGNKDEQLLPDSRMPAE